MNKWKWNIVAGVLLFAGVCLGQELRFTATEQGRLSTFEVRECDAWRSIPFRTDVWGTSWYVRDSKGIRHSIPITRTPKDPNRFSGSYEDIHFELSYAVQGKTLAIVASLANKGTNSFSPMSAGLCLGVNSYQEKFPDWRDKFVPNVMRCEPTHHWGFAMSPDGGILGWVCADSVASYSINYEPRRHRIYTPNIDFINQLPLPKRHPKHLHTIKPGEVKTWTVYLTSISSIEQVKADLSDIGDVPIFDAERYTVAPREKTRVSIFGPAVRTLSVTLPQGKEVVLHPTASVDGRTDYIFNHRFPGLCILRAKCENGRIAEGTIFIRQPWRWYLERARIEGLRVKPTKTHHAECIYPFFSYFLAKKHFPDADLDAKCENVFQHYFPQHYDPVAKKLKVDWRIQDTAVWAGVLADRFAVTGNQEDLEHASFLVDFLIHQKQGKDGGFYAHKSKTHYTSVIYLAKSIMEVMKEEKKLAATSKVWADRYQRHQNSVDRAIADLGQRRDNVETEGQQTYEDGMISCTLLQLAMYALKTDNQDKTEAYTEAAESLFQGHRCLTLSLHPDARVNNSTIRFWEAQYTICLMANMYNSPCGWSAWKLYGDYYLYLLTGKEEYLRDAFNGLGACIQLIDYQSGKLRWGFTPDPFIYTRWAVPADKPNNTEEHKWVTGVRGEEYLEQISDWNRSKKIWRRKWGIDNFTHEIFKCMEEMALNNAYLLERVDGSYVGYNCNVRTEGKMVIITPYEDTICRIHLNLRKQTLIRTTIKGKLFQDSFSGMKWIGPGGLPEDVRPFRKNTEGTSLRILENAKTDPPNTPLT